MEPKKAAVEVGSKPEEVGQKRRASCSLANRRAAPSRKAARLSLDSKVQMDSSRPIRNDRKQRSRGASQDDTKRSRRSSPSPSIVETPNTAAPASNGVKVEQETK